MNVAIITARGGSKRIPGKNIKAFCGKPIIAYSIEAALKSGIFDEVMVSTDDVQIADIAKSCGAQVPFMRTAETADDYATTTDVLAEVLADYRCMGKTFNWLCCVYPTAPFVTADKLRAAWQLLMGHPDADAVVPVVQFAYPPLRGLVLEDSKLKMKWPEHARTRSQDLEPIYHDCGQFYFTRIMTFQKEKTLFCSKAVPLILSDLEVQDIDNETDWEIAEIKYTRMLSR